MIAQAPAAFRLTVALDGRSRSVMNAHASAPGSHR